MALDMNTILLGCAVSMIGVALVMYGRKAVRVPHIVVGVVLIAYPYFIGNALATVAIAVVLVGGLALASRLGI